LARIGLDVDGVLADFTSAYVQLMYQITGRGEPALPEDWQPSEWNFEHTLGFGKDIVEITWDIINASSTFWFGLTPLTDIDLESLSLTNDLYFITTRPGTSPKQQTENWLKYHFGMTKPTVLISDDKGAIARGLKLDIFIDDRDKNLWAVKGASPATQCYVLDYPYNRNVAPAVAQRISSLREVICDGHLAQVGC
jgi:5'(3')-deoxyribonucleotidase